MRNEIAPSHSAGDHGVGSSVMPDLLYNAFVASVPNGIKKGDYFSECFEMYAAAWKRGHVPRVHLGAPSGQSSQRTFYLPASTLEIMKEIAAADGVSVASVLRTAAAWFVTKGDVKGRDVWGAHRFL